jgi:hypothetical protein
VSRFDDYEADMPASTLSDDDIERLLSGAIPENDEAAQLVAFVDLIRAESADAPSEAVVARVATAAARIARSTSSQSALTNARPQRRRLGLRVRPQLVGAAAAVFLLSGVTGVALAANGAAPGDALYGIDRALEKVGIGAGHAQERLDEANALLFDGRASEALNQAAQVFDEAEEPAERFDDIGEARAALAEAAGRLLETEKGDASEILVRDNVSTLLDYLRENLGERVGDDGSDFGHGVAEIARGITPEEGEADPTPSPADNNSRKDDEVGGHPGGGSGNGGEHPGGGSGNGGEHGEGNGPPSSTPSGTAPGQRENP